MWKLGAEDSCLTKGLTSGRRLHQAYPCPFTLFCFTFNAFLAQVKVLQQL